MEDNEPKTPGLTVTGLETKPAANVIPIANGLEPTVVSDHRTPKGLIPWKKGQSGNPAGLSKAAKQARDVLHNKLAQDADIVHDALIKLIQDGNSPAILYAHQQLYGKPKDVLEVTAVASNPFEGFTAEELSQLARDKLNKLKP